MARDSTSMEDLNVQAKQAIDQTKEQALAQMIPISIFLTRRLHRFLQVERSLGKKLKATLSKTSPLPTSS